ncbi:MAG: hypothetical protein M1828_002326 [Chrysothrix sp. TS-e1954]|nr:MAG: hypothetical protein M1828_002326 [Chrysothrix sp. TS-e1954]
MAKNGKNATKRLIQELQEYNDEPNPSLLGLGPIADDDLFRWQAVLRGADGTAYEDGQWLLNIQIPSNYPYAPPAIVFATPICHPNVHFRSGEICLDLLKDAWTPAYRISQTLTAVHQLLTSAQPDSPLNVDIAQLLRQGDLIGAEGLVRFWCQKEKWIQ